MTFGTLSATGLITKALADAAGFGWAFGVSGAIMLLAAGATAHAQELSTIADEKPVSQGLANDFREAYESLGGDVLSFEIVPEPTIDPALRLREYAACAISSWKPNVISPAFGRPKLRPFHATRTGRWRRPEASGCPRATPCAS